jgi:competence protein ComEC
LGVARIDLLVLTHHHADHVGGVPGVLAGRAVAEVLVSPLREPADQTALVDRWLSGMAVTSARAGERRDVDGIALAILWPHRIIRGSESAPNNASVVVLADVQGVRFLLLGDVEVAAQVAMRALIGPPGVDVVKVAHHGSRVQDPALAAWTGARVAVISVGEGNRYGHPAPDTIRAWTGSGALVARTDEAGDIAIIGAPLGVVTRRTAQ